MRSIYQYIVKNWQYIIISLICLLFGGVIAINANTASNTIIIQPGYAPESLDFWHVAPVISIFIILLFAGFMFGYIIEKIKEN